MISKIKESIELQKDLLLFLYDTYDKYVVLPQSFFEIPKIVQICRTYVQYEKESINPLLFSLASISFLVYSDASSCVVLV